VRCWRCAVIALHTLVGIVLLSVPLVLIYGLLILNRKPPPWLLDCRTRSDHPRLAKRLQLYGIGILVPVATLGGLNLAFGFHPLGIDYHQPWTYLAAVIPSVVLDFLGRRLLQPKELYSAVSDDWLLWDNARVGHGSVDIH
jgi:hypothetical protein